MASGEKEEGILLYYKFVQIPEVEKIRSWLLEFSSALGLVGRIRVAPDGVNVTVGGKMTSLQEHIRLVGSDPMFDGTDFKLAAILNSVNRNPDAVAECGFTSLSARIVKELVTLGLPPSVEPPSVTMAGRHVTAQKFHEILQGAFFPSEAAAHTDAGGVEILKNGRSLGTESGIAARRDGASKQLAGKSGDGKMINDEKKTVVVDARNVYETRIGKFRPPIGIEMMDPMVRQYSDLPRWIDEHEEHLRNKQILMYCTGGVRCEMASAYIRSKGDDFEDVLQLSGGIQRYLEAFPDGGLFAGKNFVFDHRLAVPSSNEEVVGECLLCSARFDDYSDRCRCSLCRMLVLVCIKCQDAGGQESGVTRYVCELCKKDSRDSKPSGQVRPNGSQIWQGFIPSCESVAPLSDQKNVIQERKLKILCLHGFRQSASSLKGRLNALRKKLRQKVELVFIDAPHEITSFNLCSEEGIPASKEGMRDQNSASCQEEELSESTRQLQAQRKKVSKKFAWLISPISTANDAGSVGTESRFARPDFSDRIAALECPAPLPSSGQCKTGHSEDCLELSPKTLSRAESETTGVQQYQTQTEGWSRSLNHLRRAFAELGPFDGLLGFSQGAAVAAALCTLRGTAINDQAGALNFSFVILCSGFQSPGLGHMLSLSSKTAINCPSLHVFGGSPGLDRQISSCKSEELVSLFTSHNCLTVRHNSGHIIPTQLEYVQQYLAFLGQFQ